MFSAKKCLICNLFREDSCFSQLITTVFVRLCAYIRTIQRAFGAAAYFIKHTISD